MAISLDGSIAHLHGDWTIKGLTKENINLLTAMLQKIDSVSSGKLLIICKQISDTDFIGLQLLKVWMQCVRLRGVEPELVDPPAKLLQYFKSAGLDYHLSEEPVHVAKCRFSFTNTVKSSARLLLFFICALLSNAAASIANDSGNKARPDQFRQEQQQPGQKQSFQPTESLLKKKNARVQQSRDKSAYSNEDSVRELENELGKAQGDKRNMSPENRRAD